MNVLPLLSGLMSSCPWATESLRVASQASSSGAVPSFLTDWLPRVASVYYAVDVGLTPVAFLAAQHYEMTLLAVTPLLLLLAAFSRERRDRLESVFELTRAYRGMALVLGDVVEADDRYTGEHCQGVVELARGVGRQLGLDADEMRDLEFGALLHDVGKV